MKRVVSPSGVVTFVIGPTGTCRSSRAYGRKMSSGVWPSCRAAIVAPGNAARTRKMMKMPAPIATLSRLNRRQTCSQ